MPATTEKSGFVSPNSRVWDPSHLRPFAVPGLESVGYHYSWPAGETITTATTPLQFKATEAQMVVVLEMYAAKQKSRVGAG